MESVKAKTLRPGFTLIELLIVITIIGILAAIALPKFNHVRNRGHFKAMMSDLRNLMSQQEVYRSHPTSAYNYAGALSDMPEFHESDGVNITITAAGTTGWAATAAHSAMGTSQTCAVFAGTVPTVPSPAVTAGVVTCTGEN